MGPMSLHCAAHIYITKGGPMILRVNGGAGSKSRSKAHRQFLQMLVDRLNLTEGLDNAVIGTDDGGYRIYFESDIDNYDRLIGRTGA